MVNKVAARNLGALVVRTKVDMDFRAWATRTCITHFPEIVMLVTVDDSVCRKHFCPVASSLVVTVKTILLATLEHSGVKTVWIKLQHVNKILPSPSNSLFLEVVAERPVSKHLEHSVVVSVMSYLLKIVVLT